VLVVTGFQADVDRFEPPEGTEHLSQDRAGEAGVLLPRQGAERLESQAIGEGRDVDEVSGLGSAEEGEELVAASSSSESIAPVGPSTAGRMRASAARSTSVMSSLELTVSRAKP
jgi:hypothetical protein